MKKYFAPVIIGMVLTIFAFAMIFALINISNVIRGSNSAKNETQETIKVSLDFSPEENESDLVSSDLEKHVEILGEGDVKETSGVAPSNSTKQNTIGATTTPAPSTSTETPSPPPLTNGTCPVSTLNCIPCNINDGHWACRVESGEDEGYLGWSCQNNNPGNIRPSTFRETIIKNNGGPLPCGKRIDPLRGEYMIFSTYSDGRNAMKAYIRGINQGQHSSYTNCGNCTLRFFLEKWSANTTTYANGIGARMGVNPDEVVLDWVVNNKLDSLIDAMQMQEGFFVN